MRIVYSLLWLLILLVGIVFGLLNPQQVHVDYFARTAQIFLPLLMLIVLAVGAVLGWLAISPSIMRLRRSNRLMRKQLRSVKSEFEQKKALSSYYDAQV
jgi:lipopolysaccharide assembly protein A